MGYIYKITNKINNKIYIGKTSLSVEKRFREHLLESRRWVEESNRTYSSRFYPAILKYGEDNFTVEVIEECPNSILDEREKFYIRTLNSTDENVGYNISLGGLGGPLFLGHKHSVETLKKLSENNYWRTHKQPKEYIDKRFQLVRSHMRKVQCLDTGEIYLNHIELDRKFNGDSRHAIQNKGKFKGNFYIELDDEHPLGYNDEQRKLLIKEYKHRIHMNHSNGTKLGMSQISSEKKHQIQEKVLNTIKNKSEEEKAIIRNKISQASIRNHELLELDPTRKRYIIEKQRQSLIQYYKTASQEELHIRNKHNSEGQLGKKRYENIYSKKHRMFYPSEVPEGWQLITYGFFIESSTGKKTRLRTDIPIPEGYIRCN